LLLKLIQVYQQRRGVYLEDIDGPVWLRVPPPKVRYSARGGRLTIECAAVMPVEQTRYSNELILSRATSPVNTPTSMDFGKVVNIHRDTQVTLTIYSTVHSTVFGSWPPAEPTTLPWPPVLR